MLAGELVDVFAAADAEVLEAHPMDAPGDGRDELDERDRRPVEELERFGEHDRRAVRPISFAWPPPRLDTAGAGLASQRGCDGRERGQIAGRGRSPIRSAR